MSLCYQTLSVLSFFYSFVLSFQYQYNTMPKIFITNYLSDRPFSSLYLQLCPVTLVVILDSFSMATSRGPPSTSGTKSATAAALAMCWRATPPCPVSPLQPVLLPGISPFHTAEVCKTDSKMMKGLLLHKINV